MAGTESGSGGSVVNTHVLPPRERYALWREALAATHEVSLPEGSAPEDFNAWARTRHLGKALLLESQATPQWLHRSARKVRADQLDHYIVRLQMSGSWTGDIGGCTVTAPAGSVMALDMARASRALTTDITNINLMVPRDALDDLLPPFDMHGLVLQNGMAALLGSHLTELARHLSSLGAPDVQRLADATLSLVAACLAPSRDTLARARAPLKAALIAEVRRHVDRHLSAPDLTPSSVAEALGLSRSALYAVCEPVGGVAAFIQQRRLKRIHAILADPRERRPVAEIAYQHGFANAAHFSRAFRRAFGYSPREARWAAAARAPNADDAGAAGATYEAWVRSLGS